MKEVTTGQSSFEILIFRQILITQKSTDSSLSQVDPQYDPWQPVQWHRMDFIGSSQFGSNQRHGGRIQHQHCTEKLYGVYISSPGGILELQSHVFGRGRGVQLQYFVTSRTASIRINYQSASIRINHQSASFRINYQSSSINAKHFKSGCWIYTRASSRKELLSELKISVRETMILFNVCKGRLWPQKRMNIQNLPNTRGGEVISD